MQHIEELENLGACTAGLNFAAKFESLADAWASCEQPNWLLWYARKRGIDKVTSFKISIFCARLIIQNFEQFFPGDNRPRLAIESAEKWLENPTEESAYASAQAAYAAADSAAEAAHAAVNAADAAAEAAANAAYAAVNAADAAAEAAANAAYASAHAAYTAAIVAEYAVAYAADSAAANRKQICDYIRSTYNPWCESTGK